MTAEDRAAHVEREAVAGVLAGHQKVEWGMGAGSRDKCRCGAETMYAPGDEDVSIRRERAFAAHQADAVLAALPQTGDAAAAEWAVSLVLARYCYGDEAWRPLDPEERNAIAEPYLPRARDLAPMLLAALTAGADQ